MKCNVEFSTGCEKIKVTITWSNLEVVDPEHMNLYLAWLEEDKIKSTPSSHHSLHVVQRSTTIKRSFLKFSCLLYYNFVLVVKNLLSR